MIQDIDPQLLKPFKQGQSVRLISKYNLNNYNLFNKKLIITGYVIRRDVNVRTYNVIDSSDGHQYTIDTADLVLLMDCPEYLKI